MVDVNMVNGKTVQLLSYHQKLPILLLPLYFDEVQLALTKV